MPGLANCRTDSEAVWLSLCIFHLLEACVYSSLVTAWLDLANTSILAYLDPGAGSMLLQLLLASIFGALWAVRTWWSAICAFCLKLVGRGGSATVEEAEIAEEETQVSTRRAA